MSDIASTLEVQENRAEVRAEELKHEPVKALITMIKDNTKKSQVGVGRTYLFWFKTLVYTMFLSVHMFSYALRLAIFIAVPAIAVSIIEANVFVCVAITAIGACWAIWINLKDFLGVLAERSEHLLATGEEANKPSQP